MRSVRAQLCRSRPRRYSRMLAVGAVVLALAAAGCTSSGNSPSGNTPVKGGTAVWAEPPSEVPSYIFPFMNAANESNVNLFDFQYQLYRPLYMFGENGQPTVNNTLSVANPPVFSGDKVTITLKHYTWSNGTPVTTQNIMFFINMLKADEPDFYAFVPGGFPGNVSAITAVSPTELTMTMDKPYSPTWFEYNELSLIVPMPEAWDRTASGPSSCDTTVSDCPAVYNYLAKQAGDLTGYATSPIWSIVDGPWKLSSFNADGHDTFVPNKAYTGPVKPKLDAFEEVPFTTDAAEYDVLRSGSSSTKISVGYLPDQDAPAKPANVAVGSNPLPGYTLDPLYPWGIDYYALNYQSSIGDHGAVFKQLYFRQALAYLLNNSALISGPLRGYGAATVGPVAATPPSKFLSATGRKGNPYPYNPGKAKSLLASHGWTVVPGGTTTCTDPAKCGPGITKGTALSFNFVYESGVSWVQQEMIQLQSSSATVGIKLSLVPRPFGQVIDVAGGNCVVTKSPCNWDLANWGFGWSFSPDYLPTGDELFECGAISNSGGYCNPTNDALIDKTLTSGNMQYMYNWQDYLAPQLPVEYQPNAAYTLTEVANNLKGYFPQSPTLSIYPEYWYFVK
jgi:peptide/nickel transport system substrate-binding protein